MGPSAGSGGTVASQLQRKCIQQLGRQVGPLLMHHLGATLITKSAQPLQTFTNHVWGKMGGGGGQKNPSVFVFFYAFAFASFFGRFGKLDVREEEPILLPAVPAVPGKQSVEYTFRRAR